MALQVPCLIASATLRPSSSPSLCCDISSTDQWLGEMMEGSASWNVLVLASGVSSSGVRWVESSQV